MWDKSISSPVLQLSILQGHLQPEQIIRVHITEFENIYISKSADLLHNI
jgi:hypothetical protein